MLPTRVGRRLLRERAADGALPGADLSGAHSHGHGNRDPNRHGVAGASNHGASHSPAHGYGFLPQRFVTGNARNEAPDSQGPVARTHF